jgi:hypothetical protein
VGVFAILIGARFFLVFIRLARHKDDSTGKGMEPVDARFVLGDLPAFTHPTFKKPDLRLVAICLAQCQGLIIHPFHLVNAAITS